MTIKVQVASKAKKQATGCVSENKAQKSGTCSASKGARLGRDKNARGDLDVKAWVDEILQSKAKCRKELMRLMALVAELSASPKDQTSAVLYFDEKCLAARWGVSVKHIRNIRYKGEGPTVTYFGRNVRYRLRDVRAFEKSNAFASLAAKKQAKKS